MLPPLLLPYMEDGKMFLMLGVMALIAGCLVWLLPETKDMELMDSLEEGEEFNKHFGGFSCLIARQQSGSQQQAEASSGQHRWDRDLSNQDQKVDENENETKGDLEIATERDLSNQDQQVDENGAKDDLEIADERNMKENLKVVIRVEVFQNKEAKNSCGYKETTKIEDTPTPKKDCEV